MKSRTLIALLAGGLTVSNAGQAQLPASGTITGRILNPSTGEYVRNAQVRDEATGVVTTSEAGGEYQLSPAGPGQVTLTVTYTGYRTATATVTVAPGATVTQNFELVSTLDAAPGRSDEAIRLAAFVVSIQREGNAKAIMEQRNSMNITNSVSADALGEVAEGNVGEFLKHLPGVDYDSLDGTVRYVSLRGLGTEYAGVTIDGMNYPSANAEGVSRGFSFEQVSLSAMESVEVSKTADFKATPHLILSLGVMYNHSDVWSGQRSANFNTGTRGSAAALGGGDPLTRFTTTANGAVTVTPLAIAKVGNGNSYSPRFSYTRGDLTVEGRYGISDSISGYNPMKYRDSVYTAGGVALANVRFSAERSSLNTGDWRITQTAGGDWNDGALYSAPLLTLEDGRNADDQLQTGELITTLRTHRILAVEWKAGAKWKREVRSYANRREASNYAYVGPGAGTGQWRDYRSPLAIDYSAQGMQTASISGGGVFLPDLMRMARTFRERPGDFESRVTATNFYSAVIANERDFEEDITSLFLMGTTKLGPVNVRAGLRREDTETDALEFDARSSNETRAAGYAVSAGRATTVPGLQYQYLSRPKVHRTGGYDNLFPSAAVKYNLTRQIDLQVGFSRTIRRPSVTSLAGVWLINDDDLTVNAPNVNLQPEYSDNFSVRLARYFEPVGVVAMTFFQNNIEGLHQTGTRIGSEEFAPGEKLYEGYTFITTTQSKDDVRVRGMELEYSQGLSFLPRPWSGFSVRANYTRNYAQVTVANMSPHLVSAGLNFAHRRGQFYASMNWAASRPINASGTQYQRHRINVDFGGSYRFAPRVSGFFSVRNVLNEPFIRMEKVGTNPAVAQFFQKFGVTPTVGVRTTF